MAGIRKLARDFAKTGVKYWQGTLQFLLPFDDSTSGSTIPSLVINDNLIDVIITPSHNPAYPPNVFVNPPDVFTLICNLTTCANQGCTTAVASVNFTDWTVTVSGTVWTGETQVPFTFPIYDPTTNESDPWQPEKLFQHVFISELKKLGVHTTAGNFPGNGKERYLIGVLKSKPFSGN